jgi:membrane protease YdiL (CAAX protease family)
MMVSPETLPSSPSPENPPWGRRELLKAAVLIVLGSLLLIVLAGVGMVVLGLDPATAGGLSSPLLFGAGVGVYGLVILAVYWFAVRRAGGSWALVGVRSFDARWWLALPVLFLVQMAGMALINGTVIPWFTGDALENPQVEAITGGLSLSTSDLLLLLFLVALIGPVAEELFFRGMLYPVMRRRRGPTAAVVLNAILFALIHFIPILLPSLFLIGLIFAWVRERSGSIIPSIVLHVVQNGLVVYSIFICSRIDCSVA